MLDKLTPSAEETARETAEGWMDAFGAALARGDERALADLFMADAYWRNLFGLSWRFATFPGVALASELLQRAREVRADGFRLDPTALAPRHSVVAGREVIEAIFAFDTQNGPGQGTLRLLPAANRLAKVGEH